MSYFIVFLFLVLLFCLIGMAYNLLVIWKVRNIDIPRCHAVHDFLLSVLDNRGVADFNTLPSLDFFYEYSWIPLEFENWSGKQFKEISETKQLFLAIKYRFFCKYKVK